MKNAFKKLISWIAYKINLPHLLQVAQERRHIEMINFQVTNNGAVFSREANVHNGQDSSRIVIGKDSYIRGTLNIFKYGGRITIGENSYVGDHSRIWSGDSVTIGDYVLIAHNVNIIDTDSHETDAFERAQRHVELLKSGTWDDKGNIKTAAIVIEDYAWISYNCSILKGVRIGKGAIVGAGSVVTRDVAPFTLVAGVPAIFIKKTNG
jgi:acetyltransferase-like isoleucine patch superfamily enzyme